MNNSDKIGYAIALFMFTIAVFLGATSLLTDDIYSQLFILFVMGLLIIAGFLMLKEIGDLDNRNVFGQKKNE